MEDGTVLVFVPKKAESAVKDSEGQTITLTYATKRELTDGSVTKLGKITVGASDRPVYLLNGVPTEADQVASLNTEQVITGKKTFTRGTETDLIFLKSSIPYTSTVDRSRNIVFVDVDGQAVGRVGNTIGGNTGRFGTRIIAYDPATGDNSILGIFIDKTTGAKYGEVPPVPVNAPSNAIVNKGYVESTDEAVNGLVHKIDNENIGGLKNFIGGLEIKGVFGRARSFDSNNTWVEIYRHAPLSTSDVKVATFVIDDGFNRTTANDNQRWAIVRVRIGRGTSQTTYRSVTKILSGSGFEGTRYALVKNADNSWSIWWKQQQSTLDFLYMSELYGLGGRTTGDSWTIVAPMDGYYWGSNLPSDAQEVIYFGE